MTRVSPSPSTITLAHCHPGEVIVGTVLKRTIRAGNFCSAPHVLGVMLKTIPILVAVALIAGCAGTSERTPTGSDTASRDEAEAAAGTWVLESGRDAAGVIEPADGHPITLEIEGDGLGGTAGCDTYGGRVSIAGNSFRAGRLALTEEDCARAVAGSQQRYLAALAAAETFEVEGRQLALRGGEAELQFRRR